MDNFIFGLQNLWSNIGNTALQLFQHQLVWGFAIGFVVSTIVHLLIMSDHPKRIPHILTKSLRDSYKHLNPKDSKAKHYKSLHHFKLEYHRVHISTLLTIFAMMAVCFGILTNY